jgi:UDP-glucose 4-epimerase
LLKNAELDYVFHLAAYAAESLSHHIRAFNYTNNLVGSANIINAAVKYGAKRLVFTSSAAVYGARAVSVASTTEDTPPAPIDPYGIAKYAVEMDMKAAHEYFGLEYTIFRPHNVYGPGQSLNDGYRNVIGIFMRQALRNEPLTLFGTVHKTRQFSYIDDVAPYIARAIETPGTANQIFNIGSDPSCDIGDLAARVCRVLAVPLRTAVWPERNEARHVAVNHDKFRAVFKPTAGVPLDAGLAHMAAWARTQPLRQPKPFAAIEVERGLPESWREIAK